MIEKKPLDDRSVEVTFVVPRSVADRELAVAGEFNGWNPHATPLQANGEVCTATVVLDAGREYEFRYRLEQNWFNDEAADFYTPNEFGGHNGVIDLTDRSSLVMSPAEGNGPR